MSFTLTRKSFIFSFFQVLRRHPNSKQLVPDLISHMTQWFDLQKIHIGGTSRKKYKQLFKDCDVNEEGELDKETVIATAKVEIQTEFVTCDYKYISDLS